MSSLSCHKEGQGILLWFGKCLTKNCYQCVLGKELTLNKPRAIICSNSFFLLSISLGSGIMLGTGAVMVRNTRINPCPLEAGICQRTGN